MLTATSLSYGKAKNSTPPRRIKTPDLIEIKFGTVDYVGEITPHAKFHVNPSKVRPFGGFLRAMAQTTRSRARICLLGVKKFEINT